MAHHFTDITTILNSFSDSCTADPNTGMFFPLFNIPSSDDYEQQQQQQLDTSSTWNIQSILGFSQDTFFTPQINTNLSTNILSTTTTTGCSSTVSPGVVPAANDNGSKRKSLDTPESSFANSSPLASENGVITKNSGGGKGKKQKNNGSKKNELEKPKDVVHVRARRGQATDSHSLAERVRRGKINERLRCLQDIVPGCQKTVGMAAMLDEIINYVQSLQNQVEFLSMKLTAASNFHDFNMEETNTMNIMIQRAKAWEAGMMMQKLMRERLEIGDGGYAYPYTTTHQQHGPFDFSFGCFPTLPNNK